MLNGVNTFVMNQKTNKMDTIVNLIKKYNITELDQYVLSKFEADISLANFLDKSIIRSKQVSVLAKYKFNNSDRKKFFNLLKNNPIHNDIVFQEKYGGSENNVELNEIGRKAKRNIFIAIAVIVIWIGFAVSIDNKKSGVESSQYSFEENGVASVITIGDKNLCNIITVAGEFKSMSRGTYSVQGNIIVFNWDNLGPSEATISSENGQEILIVNGSEGTAIYRKNKN